MVEEATRAAFPFCSLENRGSTQAGDGFSSWMQMKRLCADCSFPVLSAQPLITAVELHTREQSSTVSAAGRAQCGETKSRAVFAAFLVAFTSAQSRLPLVRSLLTCRSLSSAALLPRARIRLPLQIKPAKCIEHKEPELLCASRLSAPWRLSLGLTFEGNGEAPYKHIRKGEGCQARPCCSVPQPFGRSVQAAGRLWHSRQQAAELPACAQLSVPCFALHCRPS